MIDNNSIGMGSSNEEIQYVRAFPPHDDSIHVPVHINAPIPFEDMNWHGKGAKPTLRLEMDFAYVTRTGNKFSVDEMDDIQLHFELCQLEGKPHIELCQLEGKSFSGVNVVRRETDHYNLFPEVIDPEMYVDGPHGEQLQRYRAYAEEFGNKMYTIPLPTTWANFSQVFPPGWQSKLLLDREWAFLPPSKFVPE